MGNNTAFVVATKSIKTFLVKRVRQLSYIKTSMNEKRKQWDFIRV